MKTKYIVLSAIAALALTACEDYTEHNFGTPEELYQGTQVNAHKYVFTDVDYQNVAGLQDNIDYALSLDDDSVAYNELQSVGELKYFRKSITPEEYILPYLKTIVGTSQYYAMTTGSTITVTCKYAGDSLAAGPAYVPATSFRAGEYLLVPQGYEQVLANSNNASTGTTYAYGYIYLSGTDRCPGAVTRLGDAAIQIDDNANQWLYTFVKENDHFLILGPTDEYLYMDDSHNTFQYAADLGDLDEGSQAWWTVTKNDDGTFDIVNSYTGKVILFGTNYSSAGAYADKKGTEGYVGIELYKEGSINETVDATPEEQEIVFTLDEDGWCVKGDYLNQELLGYSSTDVQDIYAKSGWSVEYVGTIGELTYVWRLDSSYGLRASAYKSGVYYPTDAWAISPVMNFKKAVSPILTFQEAQKYGGSPLEDYLQVLISTDYSGQGGQSAATWTDITDQLVGTRPDGSSWEFSDISVDLSVYAGETNVNVAFRYISTETVAATWEVKNVRCAEPEEETEE